MQPHNLTDDEFLHRLSLRDDPISKRVVELCDGKIDDEDYAATLERELQVAEEEIYDLKNTIGSLEEELEQYKSTFPTP